MNFLTQINVIIFKFHYDVISYYEFGNLGL